MARTHTLKRTKKSPKENETVTVSYYETNQNTTLPVEDPKRWDH